MLQEANIVADEPQNMPPNHSEKAVNHQGIATLYSFFVPFEGDETLFHYRPSNSYLSYVQAVIKSGELIFTYSRPYMGHVDAEREAKSIGDSFGGELGLVKSNLENMRHDVELFHAKLPEVVRRQIETLKAKYLQDRGIGASLGFPLRKRDGAPKTYSVPLTRKKLPAMPQTNNTPYNPEPVLEIDHYNHILSIISSMVSVMERSPKAFHTMKEEDLRWHFLVQLNGHYEGQATGETFNFNGKTDILVRVNGRNIFIAECKFWNGESVLRSTIDQLLGYTCWRDTKTALILFNRNKDFSAVLNQIPITVAAHPNYKRELGQLSETQFRYVFAHRDDPNRELFLTVMAFEVPVAQ